jgi:hypothetical protein
MPVTSDASLIKPVYIDAPRHPSLKLLFDYWTMKRGSRRAPARADIQPGEIRSLLGDVMIWNVDKPGHAYTIRLVGENIVRFAGRNNTGASATVGMPPEAAATMIAVLTKAVETRAPLFRTGQAFWQLDKSYRNFEACYLPLSADGETVNMILGGVKFDNA